MALFGSTSPSYPIMISLDLARDWLENNADEFIRLSRRVKKTKELCRSLGLILPEGECDPTRIAFDVQNFGFDGADVGELLRAHGIEPEYAGLGKIILIPSVMNTEEDFERLDSALADIFSKAVPCGKSPIGVNAFLPRISMTPREALARGVRIYKYRLCARTDGGGGILPVPARNSRSNAGRNTRRAGDRGTSQIRYFQYKSCKII